MEVRVANARNRCSATSGASATLSASAGSSSPCASTAVPYRHLSLPGE